MLRIHLKKDNPSFAYMKCEICTNKIEETFMGKILGTMVKDEKGKKHYICFECQKKFGNDKKEMLAKIS